MLRSEKVQDNRVSLPPLTFSLAGPFLDSWSLPRVWAFRNAWTRHRSLLPILSPHLRSVTLQRSNKQADARQNSQICCTNNATDRVSLECDELLVMDGSRGPNGMIVTHSDGWPQPTCRLHKAVLLPSFLTGPKIPSHKSFGPNTQNDCLNWMSSSGALYLFPIISADGKQ